MAHRFERYDHDLICHDYRDDPAAGDGKRSAVPDKGHWRRARIHSHRRTHLPMPPFILVIAAMQRGTRPYVIGYLLGSYCIATTPEGNSSRLTSFKSTRFDSPANNVGPCPTSLGCTTNSYSSINPSSANARGSFTPPVNSPLPDSCLSC